MCALAPHLPAPRLTEWMTAAGVILPRYEVLEAPNASPILRSPTALLEGLGPYTVHSLPRHWIPAHDHQKQRRDRTAQLLRLHSACLRAEAGDGDVPHINSCDGVVAGLLLLLVVPQLGALRRSLVRAALTHPFGSYLAAHGTLAEEECVKVLGSIDNDPRLASALCRRDPTTACNLTECLLNSPDLWAATAVLTDAKAELWLRGVVAKAAEDPTAAVTALTLQPGADEKLLQRWLGALLNGKPDVAYQAARWTKCTWASARWLDLRNQLRAKAISDLGYSFFHWFRDVEAEAIDEALQREDIETLWTAELIHASKNFGHALRRRCVLRLNSNPADSEAKLASRWLDHRGRPG
jgi:hypothetical protein